MILFFSKGDFDSKYFEDHNIKNISLFGSGDKYQIKEYYKKNYRLFNFECTLEPEFEIKPEYLNITEQEDTNGSVTSDKSININNQNLFLNDLETKDFTIIIPKSEKNDIYKNSSLRSKCGVNEGNNLYKYNCNIK